MASLVRGWVCDVAATTNVARGREKSGGDGEGWERRVKARDVMGDGGRAVLVEGEEGEGNGEGERWMLVGNGGGNVRKGEVLGVRRPVWDVELEEGRWMVGVEWGVVDG